LNFESASFVPIPGDPYGRPIRSCFSWVDRIGRHVPTNGRALQQFLPRFVRNEHHRQRLAFSFRRCHRRKFHGDCASRVRTGHVHAGWHVPLTNRHHSSRDWIVAIQSLCGLRFFEFFRCIAWWTDSFANAVGKWT